MEMDKPSCCWGLIVARSDTTLEVFDLYVNRGESLCTFVNEIIGLPLALTVFPQVYDFPGDAVLVLVEPGLYKKGWRSNHDTK